MSVNIASLDQALGQAAKLFRLLRETGLSQEALQIPVDDVDVRKNLVDHWESYHSDASADQKRARKIMGKNFFGIPEAMRHFGVIPWRSHFRALAGVPFGDGVLKEYRETHVLAAVFPLSIFNIYHFVGTELFSNMVEHHEFEKELWKEPFALDKGETTWHLVRKTAVPKSFEKDLDRQMKLLPEGHQVPSAQVMVYTLIGHYLATGEVLIGSDLLARTSSRYLNGHVADVGDFNKARGLIISGLQLYHGPARLGLASEVTV